MLNTILCITKEKLEPPPLSQLELQTDASRKHSGKPADAVCTSASRLFESARQGEAEAHESRATDAKDVGEATTDAKDVGEATRDNWVSAQ